MKFVFELIPPVKGLADDIAIRPLVFLMTDKQYVHVDLIQPSQKLAGGFVGFLPITAKLIPALISGFWAQATFSRALKSCQ